tara:strand:+ start:223 stop:477 length:255 start_codon:yes stop_codon:yes gene_type:complete
MDCPVSNTGKTVMTIVIDREVVGGLSMEEGSNNGPLLCQQDLQPVAETVWQISRESTRDIRDLGIERNFALRLTVSIAQADIRN